MSNTQVKINDIPIDEFMRSHKKSKDEYLKIKKKLEESQLQLNEQGKLIDKLKKDNERYKTRLQEFYGVKWYRTE